MKINVLKVNILLAEKQMTQTQLAEKCEFTRQNVSKILAKGRCAPATAGRIAAGLGVHVSEIVEVG